jgi:RNA polymerase sigma-70 factor (ECF subfamily)
MAEAATMPSALDQIYEQHHNTVFAAAYRVTGSAADAEDVLHTVFLRLLKRDDPGLIGNPESYLRRAAINAALDIVRARRGDATDFDRMPSTGRSANDRLENEDLKRQLRAALATLPPRTAEAFVLRYFEDRRNPEIAKMLGITQIGVAVTLHRARKKLQDELRKAGVRA